MKKYIKPLIFANLFVICLTNCSLMPKSKQEDLQKIADSLPALPNPNKSLKNAKTISASPPWLAQLMKTARELGKDEEVSLFPAGMKDSYVPAKAPSKKKNVKITGNYDVRSDSGISAEQLNKRLKGKLKGKGSVIIQAGKKNNIDPLFLYGIIVQESGYGVSDYTNKYSNCMGRLYKDKKSGKWLPMKFNSVDECIEKTAQHLKINYIGQNLYTISAVKSKYCPDVTNKKSKDFNDKRGVNSVWKNSIVKHMNNAQSI